MESTTYNPKDSVKLTEFDNSKAQRSTETRQLQRETAASTSHPRRSSSLPDRDRLRTLETSGSTEVGAKPSPSHSRDGGQLDQNKSKDLHERRSKHTKEQSHRPSQEYKEKDSCHSAPGCDGLKPRGRKLAHKTTENPHERGDSCHTLPATYIQITFSNYINRKATNLPHQPTPMVKYYFKNNCENIWSFEGK